MEGKIIVTIEIPSKDGSKTSIRRVAEFDASMSQDINLKFLSEAEGGPVMRPNNPPTRG